MTVDPNNRPGGESLILTAKSADKVQFFDAGTLALQSEIAMPGSTHEMVRSLDGATLYASIYGGGIFGKNKDPDRRIAVIDLAGKTLERTIDVGENFAPHSVMMDARGTLTVTSSFGAQAFFYYVIDADHLQLLSADAARIATGTLTRQPAGPFTTQSFTGGFAFVLAGSER